MGRNGWLVRMALGRSPYEPVEPVEPDDEPPVVPSNDSNAPYIQQYNNRGNPINPETARLESAMISAKNEVLAAVGVCELKDAVIDGRVDGGPPTAVNFSDEEWMLIREAENDQGEWIRMFAECGRNALTWWVVALRRRLQVGILSSDLSFVQILLQEWHSLSAHGTRGAITYLATGGLPEVTAQLFLTLFDWILGEQVLQLSGRIIRLKASSGVRSLMLKCVSQGYRILNIGLMLLVYPMTAFSSLQQLGLISSTPFGTPRSWLLPWNPSSPLQWTLFGRQDLSPRSSRLRTMLLSPTTLWVTMTVLQNVAAANHGHTPLCENEAILGPHNKKSSSRFQKSSILTPFSNFRDSVLRKLGWAPEIDPHTSKLQRAIPLTDGVNDYTTPVSTRRPETSSPSRIHCTTELSTLPSHFLALNLDSIFWTVLLLPLDILHLHGLASSFLASDTARLSVIPSVSYNAITGLRDSFTQSRAGKVGLCLVLQHVIDTAVWAGVYWWTKRTGIQSFHWGNR